MECSNSVDTIGKMCKARGIHQYVYKKNVKLLPLAMVDDLLGFSECSNKSISLNNFINTHIEMKRGKFHTPNATGKRKCHKIHVGGNHATCPILKVHDTVMEDVSHDTYLGDIISGDGRNTRNIKKRVCKGLGIITKIVNLNKMNNWEGRMLTPDA